MRVGYRTGFHTLYDKKNSNIYTHTYIYIYIYIKLVTVVDGDPKSLFSAATKQRCKEGCNSFPWITSFYP